MAKPERRETSDAKRGPIQDLREWLQRVEEMGDLLRVKGIVNVAGEPGPVVVQGAQHVFHPPVTLDAWPSGDRRSRIVFITRNLARESIEALFAAVGTLAAPAV